MCGGAFWPRVKTKTGCIRYHPILALLLTSSCAEDAVLFTSASSWSMLSPVVSCIAVVAGAGALKTWGSVAGSEQPAVQQLEA